MASGGRKYSSKLPLLSRGVSGGGNNDLDPLTAAVYNELRGAGGVPRRPQPPPTDSGEDDLLAVMSQRLRTLEESTKKLREELMAKDKEVLQLKKKLYEQEGNAADSHSLREENEVLRIQNSKLALQVVEMTQYLKENGLQWVGSGRISPLVKFDAEGLDGEDALQGTMPQGGEKKGVIWEGGFQWGESVPAEDVPPTGDGGKPPEEKKEEKEKPPASTMYFTMKTLQQRVTELNLLIGEKKITSEAGMCKFAAPDTLEIVVYSDGICVNQGPFRPYTWSLCRAFIDDILEGFFPYEYKERYPDGMLLKLHDESSTPCPKGRKEEKVHGLHGEHGYRIISKNTFLNRLPNKVITKSGQVVDVKKGVQEFMDGSPALSTIVVEKGKVSKEASGTPVVLQIRVVGGPKLVAHLFSGNTIGDVRGIVREHLPTADRHKDFELLTAFPRQTFTNDLETLDEAKLVPNAALLMRLL